MKLVYRTNLHAIPAVLLAVKVDVLVATLASVN
jgi:hypothetical protein